MNENYTKERILYFKSNAFTFDEYKALCDVLADNNIPHVCYYDGCYPTEVIIRKSKKTWNDVMRMVNSIHAVKYTFKTMCFNSEGKPVDYQIIYA